jgi:oligogalacturonide lyase
MVSRRQFLIGSSAASLAFAGSRPTVPSEIFAFQDPATEFRLTRLTSPGHASYIPGYQNYFISRRTSFFLFSNDRSGSLQPYRMEIKRGESSQLAEARGLHPESLSLAPDEKSFFFLDADGVHHVALGNQRDHKICGIAGEWEPGEGLGVSTDGLYAVFTEKRDSRYRIRLVNTQKGEPITLAEGDAELSFPMPRPRRAGVLYRKAKTELWLANYDGHDNRRLATAAGGLGPAMWSKDGRTVLYLNLPSEPRQPRNIREYTPDFNQDALVANTSQYANFCPNGDGSVFVGASASKASPYLLLLLRSVRRELTICEHHATDAALVSPVFSPDSQRIFFQSDKEGKMAVYTMNVERLVEATEE